jgi:hypothetical protein
MVEIPEVAAEQLGRVILISTSADGSLPSEARFPLQSASVNPARFVCSLLKKSLGD